MAISAQYACLLIILACFTNAIGLDLNICGDWNVECNCGSQYKIIIPIKQCSRFYRWKHQCKPCSDININSMCSKYANCLECSKDKCTRCPPNRYGQWCAGVCQCQNGGICTNDGLCSCPSTHTGPLCQISKCSTPEPIANGDIAVSNFDIGSTAIYTCKAGYIMSANSNNARVCTSNGQWSGQLPVCEKRCSPLKLTSFVTSSPDTNDAQWFARTVTFSCQDSKTLMGPQSINCLPTGEWDNQPPNCVTPCPIPSNIENGHAFYQNVNEGSTVRYVCAKDYYVSGEKEIKCTNGNWSHPPPKCEKVLYCSDPGIPEFAERQVVIGIGDSMSVGTQITYTCTAGSIQIGPSEMTCQPNATWTNDRPYCVFVSDKEITCETKGSDVLSANHAPQRITCPSGCKMANPLVWGTVIYKKDSRLCLSALHAGMISPEGGSVLLLNNGLYNQFVPSNSNGIKSKRHRGSAESYRFNFVDDDEEAKCPRGWTEFGNRCLVFVDKATAWKQAQSICQNLNSKLFDVNNNGSNIDDMKPKLSFVRGRIWSGSIPTEVAPDKNETSADNNTSSNSTIYITPITVSTKLLATNSDECATVDIQLGDLNKEDCLTRLSFLCSTEAKDIDIEVSVCEDPEPVTNSNVEILNQIDELYNQDIIIKYECKPLYYLSGPSNITCLENSTWSSPPPKCIRAAACTDPPPVNNGIFTVIPEPKFRLRPNSGSSQQATAAVKHLTESEKTNIPKSFHKVNTKIQFECESRYYKLIGSSSRTCLQNSKWSGRQPSCQPICGTSSAPRPGFIVGGEPSVAGQWPWQVAIARRNDEYDTTGIDAWYLICGAALLTESWVVTAAHCVTQLGSTDLVDISELRLYFGKYHRNDSQDDSEVQIREIDSIQVYPDFNPVIYDSDIALINLKSPVKLTSRVQPVCLPDPYSGMSARHLKEGSQATVTGWGRDKNNDTESYPEVLMQAKVKIVSNDECELGYQVANVPLSVTGNMFCAGSDKTGKSKADSCSGDSGGPLVVPEGNGVNEKWYLEGLVSWGSPNGCGLTREYGGYTRVSMFLDWVKQFI